LQTAGDLVLLKRITPRTILESSLPLEFKVAITEALTSYREVSEEVSDEKSQNKVILEVQFSDHLVQYNPNPLLLFSDILNMTWQTLTGLVSGHVNAKDMAGPIGMLQIMQISWGLGIKSALFVLAFISLNLGFINLLPIPVLDGGYVLFSVIEMFTKKPLKAKTMERLIIPFIALLILGILYITYHDILRIFGSFFK
jgi:regulator of sigma E protease